MPFIYQSIYEPGLPGSGRIKFTDMDNARLSKPQHNTRQEVSAKI